MVRMVRILGAAALAAVVAGGGRADAASCESLGSLTLSTVTITSARVMAAGAFTPPPDATPRAREASYAAVPSFCRVTATLRPSSDSDIKVEVWLPVAGWNGRFEAVGNGGWAGSIGYQALSDAVRDGYAAAATDTGHKGGRATFALGHPEKLIDNAYRAVHEMTVHAKEIVAAFYGNGPKFSYWNGCSSGGKQGLKEAQRFPSDFDGIIAGAPANNMIHLHAGSLWNTAAVHATPASYIPPDKYTLIHQAVLEACDARDGVKDGLIQDPGRCDFDPQTLACMGDDGPACLTAAQVAAARKIYSGAVNPRTGERIFPGWERGSELGWGVTAGPEPEQTAVDTYGLVISQNPGWDWHTMDFDQDVARGDLADNGTITATDPDLSAFVGHGGKLLLFHGWNDPNIAPRNTVNYYNSVVARLGSKVGDSVRLFMLPGMNHCGGGEGPNAFDKMSIIRDWVEQGRTPERIVARHETAGHVDRTRPLCPYPQTAQYTGTGSIDDAANFVCAAPVEVSRQVK